MQYHYYFAYGSNLNFRQMKKRCPGTRIISRAEKNNHTLCFPMVSSMRGNSGVASIKKSKGNTVEGVVYRITAEDMKSLDEFEALGKRYTRKKIYIFKPGNIKKLVWTYVAISDHQNNFRPSAEYLDLILSGAKFHKLSNGYMNKIIKGVRKSHPL